MTTTLVKPVWTLPGWAANVVDDNGVQWTCNVDSGWFSPLGVRSSDTEIPGYDGNYESPNLKAARVITLSGLAKAPDAATADAAVDQFNNLLSSGATLQQFLVHENSRDLTAMVKLSTGSDLTRTTWRSFEWQLVLIAPDPRKYGPTVTASTGLPSTSGGIDYLTDSGIDYVTNGGIDYGTPGTSGLLQLTNMGSAESWPMFTFAGPTDGATLIAPSATNTDTGDRLAYSGTLATSDQLKLTSTPGRRSAILNGVPYRRFLTAAEWFPVPAGATVSIQFQGTSSSGTSLLTASLAPAYL